MKRDILTYEDFIGIVHYSSDDDVFYGTIEGINDLVTFEGESVKALRSAFKDAVDDYLQLCNEAGKDPLKSFKGTFNVRISPDLHKKAFRIATEEEVSLNKFVQTAIEHEVRERKQEYNVDSR